MQHAWQLVIKYYARQYWSVEAKNFRDSNLDPNHICSGALFLENVLSQQFDEIYRFAVIIHCRYMCLSDGCDCM